MASITLLGKEFPIEYTVQVMEAVTKKYGGTAQAVEQMDSGEDKLRDTIFMLSEMMKGAERRERVRCALWGEEYTGTPALSYETLLEIMNPEDLRTMADALVEAINESSKVTTEIYPEPKKKEATK